ncbi:hypothetical protein JCM19238_236 [Vibrio ponticus]|nr:hypothetical protein JCM19238_236 [Vibrio ponticus]
MCWGICWGVLTGQKARPDSVGHLIWQAGELSHQKELMELL